jgi:putative membrane protein
MLVLWQNGIPRQQPGAENGTFAVPLTHPATLDGDAFNADQIKNHSGLIVDSPGFMQQAIGSALNYVKTDTDPAVTLLSRKTGQYEGIKEGSGGEVKIATVELMPPRHPPPAKIWDFFPPLRIFKRAFDYFKSRQKEGEDERARGGKRRRAGGIKSEIPQEIL